MRFRSFVVTSLTTRENLRLADCAFVPGLPLTGIGDLDFKSGDLTWSVTFPNGKLDYHATATSRHVTGTYKGKPVDITD